MKSAKYLVSLLLLSLGLNTAYADTFAYHVGSGVWNAEPSGDFRYQGDTIDLNSDLHLKEEQQTYTYAYVEHPFPVIPNIKISQSTMAFEGAGPFTKSFGGYTYAGNVTTKMVLDHSEVTLYYQLLDNIINIDLGLTAKKFDGKVEVTDGTNIRTTNIDQTIPMIYGAAAIELGNFAISVEANYLELDNNLISDMTTKIAYTTAYFIGVEAGIRTVQVTLDDLDSNYSSMEYTGAFANLYAHF